MREGCRKKNNKARRIVTMRNWRGKFPLEEKKKGKKIGSRRNTWAKKKFYEVYRKGSRKDANALLFSSLFLYSPIFSPLLSSLLSPFHPTRSYHFKSSPFRICSFHSTTSFASSTFDVEKNEMSAYSYYESYLHHHLHYHYCLWVRNLPVE